VAETTSAGYVDPYSNPRYAEQQIKVEAKASRDAARVAAAAAKAEQR
jgi:hypothetical protein